MLIQPSLLRLDDTKEMMIRGMQQRVTSEGHRLELLMNSIQSSSPMEILNKGYAIVTDSTDQKVIKDAGDAHKGQSISIKVAHGGLGATVTEVSR